jgi:hypothetical protein
MPGEQSASLSTNDKPVDRITGSGVLTPMPACTGGKIAGAIKSVDFTPGPEILQTIMTVHDTVHLGLEPWCRYTLPRKITFAPTISTRDVATLTAALDKSASFGSCAPTLETTVFLGVEQVSQRQPYVGEVAG